MKRIVVLLLMIGSLASAASAQIVNKRKGVQNITISTPGIMCETCKTRVEEYMVREDGVQKVLVDYKHNKTKVTYVAERTNENNIKTAIANLGFDADDITANKESYDKLPSCCKKPEDGGDEPKKK